MIDGVMSFLLKKKRNIHLGKSLQVYEYVYVVNILDRLFSVFIV